MSDNNFIRAEELNESLIPSSQSEVKTHKCNKSLWATMVVSMVAATSLAVYMVA